MNERRRKGLWQMGIGVVVILIAGISYLSGSRAPVVESFAECVAKGFPVMESYPRQCKTPDGKAFREDIGNELEKDDLIRVSNPRPNTSITSPLIVKGMARGNWFFEASFPVKLLDNSAKEAARGIARAHPKAGLPAQAGGDWMTTEFVPFEATLTFVAPTSGLGILVLEKDNPSGLPENADALRIPVTFEKTPTGDVIPTTKACVVSGCSGQICSDEQVMSTCEFKEAYACYKTARCERQTSGKCGWTETNELLSCLNQKRNDVKSPR